MGMNDLGVPVNPVTGAVLLIPEHMHSVDHEAYRDELRSAFVPFARGPIDLPVVSDERPCPQCAENRRRERAYYGVVV